MKNIVITFHRESNYGAILQTYALQQILSRYGETSILDYRRESNSKFKINKIPYEIIKLTKNMKLQRFLKRNCRISKKVLTMQEVINECNKNNNIICGSDQVWAKDITKNSSSVYNLNFKTKDNVNKISYAASIGKEKIKEEDIKELIESLKDYHSISVRENSAKEILRENNINDVRVTLDPTLLLTATEWNHIIKEKRIIKEEYIFVYMLENNQNILEQVKKLQEITKLKVVCVNTKNHFGKGTLCNPIASPETFINYIKNAKYVITNSFHGTCFSIIFNKKFGVIMHSIKSTRQQEILSKLNLEKQIINNDIEKILDDINYESVNDKLIKLRAESIDFIKNSIINNE